MSPREGLTGLRIAVVGAGISGLAAAYLLSRRHRVELFESEPRLGGHAHSHQVSHGGRDWTLDTGFLVYNHRTYPNLVRLLDQLGVEGQPSDMSFGARCRACGLEYSSRGLRGLFAQPRRVFDSQHLRMLADIPRFNRAARGFLAQPAPELTLGDFLDRGGYSQSFVRHFLLPMGGAIWSSPAADMRGFSAESFLRFFENHGWLTLTGAPQWWTLKNGSRSYVEAISKPYADSVHLSTPVESVSRDGNAVRLRARGEWQEFDRVVFATHANQALRLLSDASPEERQVLGAFRYSQNRTVLHVNPSALPRARGAWASWNSDVSDCRDERAPVSITYHLNRLHGLPGPTPFCVTLNGGPFRDEDVLAEMDYEHPLMDAGAIDAQRRLQALNGERGTFFGGAHLRYGFHEDGLVSALRIAEHFGIGLEPS